MNKIHISSFMDMENLAKRIQERYILKSTHPEGGLHIYDYSKSAQYVPGIIYDPEVEVCRGLITDLDGFVVARPFKKFHNIGMHALTESDSSTPGPRPLPLDLPFEVFDKMDGSLGILYPYKGGHRVSTRGSFKSSQAIRATEIYQEKYKDQVIPEGQTYLFEIIYPENQIVVSYPFSDLVLLGVIDNVTGEDLPFPASWPGPVVKSNHFNSFEEVASLHRTDPPGSKNSEGYVIRFSNGERAKVKFQDYLSLHRIATGTTALAVYSHLAASRMPELDGKKIGWMLRIADEDAAKLAELEDPIGHLIEAAPDELYAWLSSKINEYNAIIDADYDRHKVKFDELRAVHGDNRAAMAKAIKSSENKDFNQAVLFCFIDGSNPLFPLWRLHKPPHEMAKMSFK